MAKRDYQAPAVRVVGSLRDLTMAAKNTNNTPDGFTFHGIVLTS